MGEHDSRLHRMFRRLLVTAGLVALVAALGYGWHRAATLPVRGVEVSGAVHAEPEALQALAAVPDSARLFSLDPRLLADRVQRDPWVQKARVTRWMSGTLGIRVQERTPVVLALDAVGRPSHFLDAEGFAMPATPSALTAGFDVPLLVGHVPPFRPTVPTDDAALRRLLATLATASADADALVSAVERRIDGQLVLHTAPTPGGQTIPVWIGREASPEKLNRLVAFWDQAVLSRPHHTFRRIDLRFDGQIVTEES
jgi:cell division protein FtsQ